MDTRSKIVSVDSALASAASTRHTVMVATFDVLTAARIRRVHQIADSGGALLIAVLLPLPGSLLPLHARAELAASLAIIDLVVIADQPLTSLLHRFGNASAIFDERIGEARYTAELIAHVHQRNGVSPQ